MSHTSHKTPTFTPQPLTAQALAPYGDVIETGHEPIAINQGMGARHLDLAELSVTAASGRPAISLVTCHAEVVPVALRLVERHPLSSQAFIPMDGQRYLVVVAPPGAPPMPNDLAVFIAHGQQGINYHAGVWHHPMIALDRDACFVEVHRAGPGANCDEHALPAGLSVAVEPATTGAPT